jgi:large subunit ribosomal protein L25
MSPETKERKRVGQEVAELKAEVRTQVGTRACKRLRRKGLIPGNLYGHKESTVFLVVPNQQFSEHFLAGRRIMSLDFGTTRETGMVKEVQYDTMGDHIVHVDFTRVSLKERVHIRVPVETIGLAKGAASGGVLELTRKELDIEGPATDIPEKIELNVGEMAVGDMLRIREVELPETCKILHAQPEDVVVAVHAPRRVAAVEEAPSEEAPEAEGEPGKPEDQEEKKEAK